MSPTRELLHEMLLRRCPAPAAAWLEEAAREIARGVEPARFAGLISLASRHAPRGPLRPGRDEIAGADELLPGWNPERWTHLEAARVVLVLSRADLEQPGAVDAIEEVFRYADIGESCAMHKAIAHLPDGKRFVWRAGEGCRSSMRAVFEAAACDTPYPARHFDDLAFRQLAIKALFVEAPLWRVHALDGRIDAELARMALDLADERRAAGRPVQHELWLCLGRHGGERGRASLERELAGSNTLGRRAAAIGLARAGDTARLTELLSVEREPQVEETLRQALKGRIHAGAFRDLDPTLQPRRP